MAVTILSPWPTGATDLATAISTLKDAIAPGAADATIERLGAVASARVEQYAPRAPDVMRTEAVIQFAGYMAEANLNKFGAVRDKGISIDTVKIDKAITSNHAAAFRNCGAMALLSPWKRRRAGAINGADSDTAEDSTMPSEQLPSVTLTETPVNIADGLSPGSYEFQISAESNPLAIVLYAHGAAAPSDLADYFTARLGDTVEFTVVSGTRLWARVRSITIPETTLAIARL